MKRFLAGAGLTTYVALTAHSLITQLAFSILQLATMVNSIDLMAVGLFMLYMQTRISFIGQMIYTGVKTSITRMHIFYAGLILGFLAVIPFAFIPGGAVIWIVFQNIFAGTTVIGTQMLQAFVLTLGIVFILIDFPHRGHKSPGF